MGAVAQLDESHPEEKLKSIVEAANYAEEAARSIIFDDGFNDRIGWKLDAGNEHVTVHYKDIQGKRHFAAQTKVAIDPDVGLSLNWDHVGQMAEWNSNVKFSKLLGKIGNDTDLTHYASNDVLMVKSREFVVARRRMEVGVARIVAARSCTTELVDPEGNAVLAFLNLGMGRYMPESNSSLSRYDYVVSMDLKGMMPSYLVNQVMGKMVLSDVENHRKKVLQFGKH